MKIRTCAALLIAALILPLLSGCTVYAAEQKLEAVEDAVEFQAQRLEDAAEDALLRSVPQQPPTQPPETVPPTQAPPAVTEAAGLLTAEEAQAIALNHAGLTADQVRFLRAEYEIDDRIPQYDIEFHKDHWEYEYEIHAETGAILSFEKDT